MENDGNHGPMPGPTRDNDGGTEGVRPLLGEPRKAIVKLALPMIAATSFHTIYNFVDALWVSRLDNGADALAAVGFFFPFFFVYMALGMGLGVGAGSAISRKIGENDRENASRVATQTMGLMLVLVVVLTVPFFVFAEDLFIAMGAGGTTNLAVSYGRVMFAGTLFVFFPNIGNAILRSEGDARRAMQAMVLGSLLNIILDPIFIFVLGLGVAGAAWDTVTAMAVTSALMFHWLFRKRDTYVAFHLRGFRFHGDTIREISRVGVPAAMQGLSMAMMMFLMNLIVVGVGDTDGVAVFTTGWRVVTMAMMPVFGIGMAVTAVCGAAYGAQEFEKLRRGYVYAVRISIAIEVPAAVLIFILAPYITEIFTSTGDTGRIAEDLTLFLRITCFFLPAVGPGMLSSSMFEGTGKGKAALLLTLVRTIVLRPPLALLMAYVMDMGLPGVWWGIVMANLAASVFAYAWARRYIKSLRPGFAPQPH